MLPFESVAKLYALQRQVDEKQRLLDEMIRAHQQARDEFRKVNHVTAIVVIAICVALALAGFAAGAL
jgi:hypothetical protein